MNNEHHIRELLSDYIDGELSIAQQEAAESHLSRCAECRKELLALRSVVASLGALPKSLQPPREAKAGVEEQLFGSKPAGARVPKTAPRSLAWPVRIAAMLLVAVGSGILVRYIITQERPTSLPAKTQELTRADRPAPAEETPSSQPATSLEAGPDQSGPSARAAAPTEEEATLPALQLQRPSLATAVEAAGDTADSSAAHPRFAGHTIRGIVRDAATMDPLPGATVLVENTSLGTVADLQGRFVIRNVPPGRHKVKVTYVGYTALLADVEVKGDKVSEQDFRLPAAAIAADMVTITAQAQGQMKSITQSLSSDKMANVVSESRIQDLPTPSARMSVGSIQQSVHGAIRQFNTESYDRIYENEFVSPLVNPLSTFSIDVDVASYANVRRFVNSGSLPPKDAVRIEELVNYFTYTYPQPKSSDPVSVTTELATCPWKKDHQLLLVGLQGRIFATKDLPPSNLVFLLDVSGSMDEPNKLPLVKASFGLLVKALRPQDHVAIVVYAGRAGLVLPSTSGDHTAEILQSIENLEAGGSTAGGEGILLAYRIAKENFLVNGNNRVILATDGDFNVGVSSDADLVRLIEEKRKDGIFLSVLGFGMGNYKDSKMEKLADKGNGNYAYIDNLQEARRVLVGQMAGTLYTIAKDVKLQLEFNPAHVQGYRLIGYENRLLNKEDFNNDAKDAGELGAGQSVTALYEIVPHGVELSMPSVNPLKYQSSGLADKAKESPDLMTLSLRYKRPAEDKSRLMTHAVPARQTGEVSENFRFAASVAELGLLLRDSQFKGAASYRQVIEAARAAKGEDLSGDRSEFIRLVEMCSILAKGE